MEQEIETVENEKTKECPHTQNMKAAAEKPVRNRPEPNYILRVQLVVCLFLAAVFYFAFRQGGEVWHDLYYRIVHLLHDGIEFSGEENLTRFTDEFRGLLHTAASALRRAALL